VRDGHQAGIDHLQTLEALAKLLRAAQVVRDGSAFGKLRASRPDRFAGVGGIPQRQVAASGDGMERNSPKSAT
jgi:hypothetical protein